MLFYSKEQAKELLDETLRKMVSEHGLTVEQAAPEIEAFNEQMHRNIEKFQRSQQQAVQAFYARLGERARQLGKSSP